MDKDEKLILSQILDLYEQGEDGEAYAIIVAHVDDLFEVEPELTVRLTIELALRLNKIREAEERLRHFEDKPYVKQQVEEALRDARKDIDGAIARLEDKAKGKVKKKAPLTYSSNLSDEEISAFLSIKNKKGKEYSSFAKALLKDQSRDDYLRTGGLLTLIEMGEEEEVVFHKNGMDYKCKPNIMRGPGEYPFFESLYKEVAKKRFSEFGETGKKVLFQLEVSLFPNKIDSIASKDIMVEALYKICEALYQREVNFDSEEVKEAFMRVYELLFRKSYNPNGNLASA